MRACLFAIALAACGRTEVHDRTGPVQLAQHPDVSPEVDSRPKRRMVAPEVFLRSYLTWFGGLAAVDVPKRAGRGLFDEWNDYLGALGLPDYKIDIPRADQSNPIMLAAIGRLGEALCVRAAQHDLGAQTPADQRVVFAFDVAAEPSLDEFTPAFDVLHRTFLSYPAAQAPAGRIERFYALYQKVVADHRGPRAQITPQQAGWAAVCAALVQHPEAELY
jgi:hypothetical protein